MADTFDPTEAELLGFNDVAAVLAWTAIGAVGSQALLAKLGGPSHIRHVAMVGRIAFRALLGVVMLQDPDEEGVAPAPRHPSDIELAQMELFWRGCCIKCGRDPDAGDGNSPAPAKPKSSPMVDLTGPPSASPAQGERRVKLSSIADQGNDSDIFFLTNDEIDALYTEYHRIMGADPAKDCEPTADQISAINTLLKQGHPPFADFAIFTPHGRRMQRKLKFKSMQIQPDGKYLPVELPGPSCYDDWWACFKVLRVVLLLLKAVAIERLDAYGEFIKKISRRYPDCWWLVYLGDVRMRSEEFERIRREAARDKPKGWDVSKPWDYVFSAAVTDTDFWNEEVKEPALMFVADIKNKVETLEDLQVDPGFEDSSLPAFSNKRKRPSGGGGGGSKSASQNGGTGGSGGQGNQGEPRRLTQDSKGRNLCWSFQSGDCNKTGSSQECTDRPSLGHACEWCGGNHPGYKCSKKPHGARNGGLSKVKGKDKGKGKGKSQKGKGKGW